jgi:hypothetical protein
MQHLEGSGTPVLYIGRTVFKGKKNLCEQYAIRSSLKQVSCNGTCKTQQECTFRQQHACSDVVVEDTHKKPLNYIFSIIIKTQFYRIPFQH